MGTQTIDDILVLTIHVKKMMVMRYVKQKNKKPIIEKQNKNKQNTTKQKHNKYTNRNAIFHALSLSLSDPTFFNYIKKSQIFLQLHLFLRPMRIIGSS